MRGRQGGIFAKTAARRGEAGREQRGAACMEFIFILPILFCIFIVAVEFAQFIRVRQAALVLSREAALRASRQCGGIVSLQAGQWNTQLAKTRTALCFQKVRNSIAPEANFSLTGTTFLFSALKRMPPDNAVLSITDGADAKPLAVAGNEVTWNGRVMMPTDQFQLHEHIVLVEMRYSYEPMIAGALAIIGIGPVFKRGGVYREITIF
jgi:hypothetical protein